MTAVPAFRAGALVEAQRAAGRAVAEAYLRLGPAMGMAAVSHPPSQPVAPGAGMLDPAAAACRNKLPMLGRAIFLRAAKPMTDDLAPRKIQISQDAMLRLQGSL